MPTYDDHLMHLAETIGDRTKLMPRRAPVRRTAGLTTVDPRTYGAVCDGVTDDWAAFKEASRQIESGSDKVLLVPGRMRLVQPNPSYCYLAGTGNYVRGVTGADGSAPHILLEGGGTSSQLFHVESGTHTRFEDFTIERKTNGFQMAIALLTPQNVTLDRVRFVGNADTLTGEFVGLNLRPGAGTLKNVSLIDCEFETCFFGVSSDSGNTGTIDGFVARGCTFHRSTGTDLELNWPNGVFKNVVVAGNRFRDNRAGWDGAAWGVGLAKVDDVLIEGNHFDGYPLIPIHIEDYSNRIRIRGNRFENCATQTSTYASHIFIVSGPADIKIDRNLFDMGVNGEQNFGAVYAGDGGYAGRPMPSGIVIDPNNEVVYGGRLTKLASDYTGGGITVAPVESSSASTTTTTTTTPVTVYGTGFETDLGGWADWGAVPTRDTSTAHSGSASMRVGFTNTAPNQAAKTGIPVTAGKLHTLTAWVKGTAGEAFRIVANGDASGQYGVGASVTCTGGWDQLTYTFTPAAGNTSITLVTTTQTNPLATAWFDDIQINA